MQQITVDSGLQGSQAQGSVSSQSTRSVGDPPQNSCAISSRSKKISKKRERSIPVCNPAKSQRSEKSQRRGEEGDSTLKPEASSLVGKDGGISCLASVDRLVCIMQYEWNDSTERRLELVVSRTMLAKVVATTTDLDCLLKFLKLGGLSILDKWLQEAHRGKHFVNKEISEDIAKAVEDLLLALLGALEILPVDLLALKICPVGKSVSLLRNYKHIDIQRRAKKLVDMWRKRVGSEMNQAIEGNDSPLATHQQSGAIGSKTQQAYCLEPMPHGNPSGSRGKFASVASLCSSQEDEPSNLLSMPSVVDSAGDMARKVALSAQAPLRPHFGDVPDSPHFLSSPSRDGRIKTTSDVSSAQLPSDIVEGSKTSGTSRNCTNFNANSSISCSVTGAVSVPMNVFKHTASKGIKEAYECAAQSGPCCSSSPKNPQSSLVYDGLSRSSFNSLSSCATDWNNRFLVQDCMYPEPAKAGIQRLASIAASEGSMVDVKGSDTSSNISVSMQRLPKPPVESNAPIIGNMKDFSRASSKAASREEGEHYDHISSTVSSPSETSAHVELLVCDSKRTLAASVMTSPHDTMSETNLISTFVRKDGGYFRSLQVDQQNVQAVSENMRSVSLLHALGDEAVWESTASDRSEGKDKDNVMLGVGLGATVMKGGLCRPSPLRHNETDCLDAARQAMAEVQQGVGDLYERSCRVGTPDRNLTVCGDATFSGRSLDNKLRDSLLKGPCKSGVFASVRRDVQDRPIFDLNEMLVSEESATQAVAASSSVLTRPTHASSGSNSALHIAPLAPIAVVAAVKGLSTLPSASHVSSGWKGSAPTSAFRPTQPRNYPQKPNSRVAEYGASVKVLMDFDLNVAADPSFVDNDMGLSSSTAAAPVSFHQDTSVPNFGCSGFSQKANRMPGATWDLNQVDGVAESQGRPVFDLNSGPTAQDNDDVVLASKHHGNCCPLSSDVTNTGTAIRMPSHPLSSVTPIMMPAFALTNSEFSYPVGGAPPWSNSGPHEGMRHYNVFVRSQPGVACPPTTSMPTGPYGGSPFGFSPAAMQSFSAPFVDMLCGPHTAPLGPYPMSNGQQSVLSSQTNMPPPYMISDLADTIQHQGKGSFWSRANVDLNAGPDGINAQNLERRQMLLINEQMRATHQTMDMAGVLKQSLSMQGALSKQPAWH